MDHIVRLRPRPGRSRSPGPQKPSAVADVCRSRGRWLGTNCCVNSSSAEGTHWRWWWTSSAKKAAGILTMETSWKNCSGKSTPTSSKKAWSTIWATACGGACAPGSAGLSQRNPRLGVARGQPPRHLATHGLLLHHAELTPAESGAVVAVEGLEFVVREVEEKRIRGWSSSPPKKPEPRWFPANWETLSSQSLQLDFETMAMIEQIRNRQGLRCST